MISISPKTDPSHPSDMPDPSHLSCVHSVPAMVKKILLTLFLALPLLSTAAPLDDRITAFKSAATQNEPAVSEILQLGLTENRSALAFAAVKPWLAQNEANSVKFLFLAAQSAEFAGEWRQAVSFYRKLLKSPDIDASTAAIAAPSCYRLLINHLGDADSAYLLMREEGLRLRNFGNNRQFDAWFLAKTAERKDLASTAKWLAAIYQSDEPREAYEPVLTALLEDLETYTYNQPALFNELKSLAAAKHTTPLTKARVEWSTAIVTWLQNISELSEAKRPIPDEILDAPLKAARELINASPYEGSIAVSRGWMHFSMRHTETLTNLLKPRRAEKSAPILAALRTLPPEKANVILNMQIAFSRGRKVVPYLITEEEVRALTAERPQIAITDVKIPEPNKNQPPDRNAPHPDSEFSRELLSLPENAPPRSRRSGPARGSRTRFKILQSHHCAGSWSSRQTPQLVGSSAQGCLLFVQ